MGKNMSVEIVGDKVGWSIGTANGFIEKYRETCMIWE